MASTDPLAALVAPKVRSITSAAAELQEPKEHLRQQLSRIDELITGVGLRWLTKEWLGSPPAPQMHHYHAYKFGIKAGLDAARIRLPEEQWRCIEELVIAWLQGCVDDPSWHPESLPPVASRAVWAIAALSTRTDAGELLLGDTGWQDELMDLLTHAEVWAPIEALRALPALTALKIQLHPSCRYWLMADEAERAITGGMNRLLERCTDRLTQLNDSTGTG